MRVIDHKIIIMLAIFDLINLCLIFISVLLVVIIYT